MARTYRVPPTHRVPAFNFQHGLKNLALLRTPVGSSKLFAETADRTQRGYVRGHSLTLRTSPGRSSSDFRLSVSRYLVSVATWFAGISFATAATALSRATAASQSDLRPSGAVTTTMGIPSSRARRSCCPRLVCFLAIEILTSAERRLEQMTCDQGIQLFRRYKKHRSVRFIPANLINSGTSARNISVPSTRIGERIKRARVAHRKTSDNGREVAASEEGRYRERGRCYDRPFVSKSPRPLPSHLVVGA